MKPFLKLPLCLFLATATVLLTGCGMGGQSGILGRWFSKDISIRFRENGTLLYNSRSMGLVEGRYQYDNAFQPIATGVPVKNLTVWLPQSSGTVVLDFEIRQLGSDRVQLKPIPRTSPTASSTAANPIRGVVLKRAPTDAQGTDGFDTSAPIASATPEEGN